MTRPSSSTRKYASAYYNRGTPRKPKATWTLAIQDYDKAIELDPQLASAYINRGDARYDQSDLDAAIQDFD